jgi:nucleotide-binding universal stress UspA family protein
MLPGVSETIVVGYDGKEPAKRALDQALAEAGPVGGQVVIVTVEAMPIDPYGPQEYDMLSDGPGLASPLVEPPHLKPIIDEAMQRAESAHVDADFRWDAGDPARAIVDVARDVGAAKIMIGSHHRSAFERLFGGDVATAIRREAKCDVVIVL